MLDDKMYSPYSIDHDVPGGYIVILELRTLISVVDSENGPDMWPVENSFT